MEHYRPNSWQNVAYRHMSRRLLAPNTGILGRRSTPQESRDANNGVRHWAKRFLGGKVHKKTSRSVGSVGSGSTRVNSVAPKSGSFNRLSRKRLVSETKSMVKAHEGYRKIGTGGILRSTLKVKGKAGKVKREKSVHVSKKFRAGVKQVLASQSGKGRYYRVTTGVIGNMIGYAASRGVSAVLADSSQTILGTPTSNGVLYGTNWMAAGCKTLWNMLYSEPIAIGAGAPVGTDTELNFFTPYKVLHAASVLYNKKAEGVDCSVTAGNLSTVVVSSTGAQVTTTNALKVNIKRSWVKFNLKNVSNRVINLDMWTLTPKVKFQTLPILTDAANTAALVNSVANDTEVIYNFAPNPVSQGAVAGNFIIEGNIDSFKVMERQGFQWKSERKEFVLQPEETIMVYVPGPTGTMDFGKIMLNGTQTTAFNSYYKGFSKSVVFGVRGDQVLLDTTTTAAATRMYGERRIYSDGATPLVLSGTVAVEFVEHYDIEIPEVAGFIESTVVAGGTQPLNLRKNKMVISNFTAIQGPQTNSTIVVPRGTNEENPVFGGVDI